MGQWMGTGVTGEVMVFTGNVLFHTLSSCHADSHPPETQPFLLVEPPHLCGPLTSGCLSGYSMISRMSPSTSSMPPRSSYRTALAAAGQMQTGSSEWVRRAVGGVGLLDSHKGCKRISSSQLGR